MFGPPAGSGAAWGASFDTPGTSGRTPPRKYRSNAASRGSQSSRRDTSVARAAARSSPGSNGSSRAAARQNSRMRPVPTFSPYRRR